MGILSSILGSRRTDVASPAGDSIATTGQYIPASGSNSLTTAAGSVLNRAGEFYKQNPKKVQAAGLIAAAMLLTRLGTRR